MNIPRMTMSLAAALLMSAAFTQSATAEVTLSFLHKWPEPENMVYFEQAVAAFEEANPDIDVQMEAVADEPYKDKIRVLMGSEQVPDVFFSWSGEFGKNFSRNGRALDITDAMMGTDWKDRFSEAALSPFRFEGRQYGVPINIDAKFVLYNKAIFAEHGLEVPETWDEFMAVNETLKEAGIEPIAFGNQYPWAASHYIGDLIAKFVPNDIRLGDYNLERPADELYTHPGYAQAMDAFKELNDKGYFNRGSNALTHSIARGSFLAGRNAMMYMEVVEFVQVTDDTELGKAGWDFFTLPSPEGGEGEDNLLTGAPDGFMISSVTEHPEEAIKFLKFLTSPEQAKKYVDTTGMTSAVTGAIDDSNASPQVIEGLEAIRQADDLALWLDTDMDARSTEVLLAGSQALLNDTDTSEAIMKRVRETAKAVQAER
jgi:raffinose/stachyose/melibiose transport system substrate-binding protein